MKKFVIKIMESGHIPPYLHVKFDGSVTDKEGVQTWLRNLDSVRIANATMNDDLKLTVCVYPIDESAIGDFKNYIETCLTKWLENV